MNEKSNRDIKREKIEQIPLGGSIVLSLYQRDLDKFKADYPSHTFTILNTERGENFKRHTVSIKF